MSPIAHRPSCRRPASGSSIVDRPGASGRGRRCPARGRRGWAGGRPRRAACRRAASAPSDLDGEPARRRSATDAIVAPASTWMPSRGEHLARRSALASGSSGARSRSATSSTVTRTPKRENACASSAPIAPPPTTISEPGSSAQLHGVAVGPVRRVRETVDRRGRRRRCRCSARRPRLAMYVVPSDLDGARRRSSRRGAAHERDAGVHEPVDGDLVVPVGRWPRRGSGRAPAPSPACTVLAPARSGDAPRLGERRRRPGSSSCSGCSRSTGTRRRPAGGRPRRPTDRPARAGSPPTRRPGRAPRRRRPPARSQRSCGPACQPRQAPGS